MFKSLQAKQVKDTAVVSEIKSLNRWETAQFSVEKVIDSGSSGNAFQQFLFGDKILLIAHGSVVAGFDMSALTSKNVKISGQTIVVTLPAPEVLSTSLDESQTRVYDRQKGLLTPSDTNLESTARAQAVTDIHQAACSEGILNTASDNAKKQLTPILSSFGFTSITINIPQGSC